MNNFLICFSGFLDDLDFFSEVVEDDWFDEPKIMKIQLNDTYYL